MNLQRAVDVFVEAFCMLRSTSYRYVPRRHGDLWIMEDQPPRKRGRKSEVAVADVAPESVVRQIHEANVGWHFLCHCHSNSSEFEAVRRSYRELGYRAVATEWVFAHDLRQLPTQRSKPPVRHVTTREEFESIPQQRVRIRRKFHEFARHYVSWDEQRDYGWVQSITVGEDAWVADLFVQPRFRRQKKGSALMCALLQSDASLGIHSSVLVASSAGRQLYAKLGYQELGTMQVLCPMR